jgi:hypothetical protein
MFLFQSRPSDDIKSRLAAPLCMNGVDNTSLELTVRSIEASRAIGRLQGGQPARKLYSDGLPKRLDQRDF